MAKIESKTFGVVTAVSMVLAVTAAVFSSVGIVFTGLYPAVIVFLFLALIPIISRFYARRIMDRSIAFKVNYYASLTVLNLLLILVILWMSFVILHDRVFGDS